MIVKIFDLVVFWIKALPPSPSMGGNLSPHQIIPCLTINYKKHCFLQSREYSQAHKSHNKTMQERTTGAISLRPTGTTQGTYFFMILMTGQIMNRQSFSPPSLPQDVINAVHRLARRNPRGLGIRDSDPRPFLKPEDIFDDNDDNYTYAPSDNDNSNNGDEIDDNDSDHKKNTKLHPPYGQ